MNKPSINGVDLIGNKTLTQLGIDLSKYTTTDKAISNIELVDAVPTGSTGTNKVQCLKIVYADDSLVDSKGQTVNHIVYLDLSTLGGSGTGTGDVSFKEYAPNTKYKTGNLIVNNNIIYKVPADFTSTTDIATDIFNGDLTTYIGTEIVDNLTTQNSNKALSANQGYVLSQKFMKNIQFSSLTKTVDITYLNGTTNSFSLKTFIDDVCRTLAQGKAIYCDKLPTCVQDANGDYIVTYIQGGKTLTTNAENTWFYYKDSNNSYVQTLFVTGTEITMAAGTIGDTITIDSKTKNWKINGIDTGVLAQGYSPIISENANNNDAIFKLDIKNYDYATNTYNTTTTPNLKGRDSVQVPLNGFYKIYVENGTLVCAVENGATPPPLALEIISGQQCLTYTVGGTIQGTLIS